MAGIVQKLTLSGVACYGSLEENGMSSDRDQARSGDHRGPGFRLAIEGGGGGRSPAREAPQGGDAGRSDDVTRLGRSPLVGAGGSVRGKGSSHAAGRKADDADGLQSADSTAGTFVAAPARRAGSSIGAVPTSSLAAMQDLGRRLEGATLGAYHLEEFVGGGGMGAVFRALDTTLDRIVAVKVLFAHESADEEVVRRFRNEAQSAARLDHENIGRVHAVGYEEGWHFIVFEFIEGMNLRDIVAESGAFGIRRTVDVTLQLAEALAHAAERDVVHRDIKPSNVIITPDGHAKLVDMGLARLHQVTGGNDLTVSGMTLGTFDYISPEQARDPRAADVRSDLYSLGCTIYFLLAGRPPFAEGTMVQKLLQHQQERAVPVERLRPETPSALAGAVARLMEKDPADRFQSPEALVADLADLAASLGIFVPTPRLERVTVAPKRRRFVLILPWLVPVAGLLAIVAAAWWFEPAAVVPSAGPAGGPPKNQRPERAGGLAAIAGEAGGGPPSPGTGEAERSLAARLVEATDGERILLPSGVHVLPVAHVVRGKSLHLLGAGSGTTFIRLERSSALPAAGISLEDTELLLEGVTVDVPAEASAAVAAEGVFRLSGVSRLVVRDASLTMRTADAADAVGEEPAVVVCAERSGGAGANDGGAVRFEQTKLNADATIVRIDAGHSFAVDVSACDVTTPRRFLLAKGSGGRASEPPSVTMQVEETSFSCGAGFACLIDTQSRPVRRRFRAVATDCRFRVPVQAALLEQAGIGEPDGYLVSLEWTDAGSRYEGSTVFRRIDGAAERVEIDYASAPQPFDHGPGAPPL